MKKLESKEKSDRDRREELYRYKNGTSAGKLMGSGQDGDC